MGSRIAALAGIGFVVLYVAAWFVSQSPDSDDASAQIAAYYSDKDHRTLMIVSAYLFVAAGLLFLYFLAGLRARLLEGATHAADAWGTFIVTAGAVFVGLLVVGAMAIASVPASMSFGGADAPERGDLVTVIQSAGYGMILVGAMLSAAAMIAATSLLTLRTGTLPRWSAWLGLAAAVLLLFAVVWFPQIVLLIWVLAISVILLRQPTHPRVASLPSAAG
jgi:MFS family permease